MALWQLDAFEYKLATGTVVTVYQLLDDATRYDVGSWANARHENSADAQRVLERAIDQFGAPQELLSDNSLAFNQLRRGRVGAVEIFLASRGTMPITGLPGKPTTQGKNERSHQTLVRFLEAHRPANLEQLRTRISRYREHYNNRRPHQSLDQATPGAAWELLAHTPAAEPIPVAVLQGKAARYRQLRTLDAQLMAQAKLTISKSGRLLPDAGAGDIAGEQAADQGLVEVTAANRQVCYQGYHVSLPTTFAGRKFSRTINDTECLLADPTSGEVLFSFPLPMIALQVRGRFVASYSIKDVHMSHPTKQWERKRAEFQGQHACRESELPAVFSLN